MHRHSRFDIANLLLQCVGIVLFVVVITLLMVHLAFSAFAHTGESDEARWFRSLTLNGISCCNVHDCKALDGGDVRAHGDHWQVRLDGEWVDVPPDRVLRVANEIGRPTVCASKVFRMNSPGLPAPQVPREWFIRCFVQGTLT